MKSSKLTKRANEVPQLTERRILHAALRQEFGTFVVKAAQTVQNEPYAHNWHIDAMVHAWLQVAKGEITRLVITAPPRCLKTIIGSGAFVAWRLGNEPEKIFLCVSYSNELVSEFNRLFRLIIEADWYKATFPNVQFTKLTDTECITTKNGGRIGIPTGGSLTGRGADVIIVDDPLKASDAYSDTSREFVNTWFGQSLVPRLNDKRTGCIVLIMQRLHRGDLAGTLLDSGRWCHLDLPAIALEENSIPIGRKALYRRKQGEALHPARESIEVLERLKAEMGSLQFSTQYLQCPTAGENLIKPDWIQRYKEAPPVGLKYQSWDCASSTSERADYSACTTWLFRDEKFYLVDCWHGRVAFPELKRLVIESARKWQPSRVLIENAGSGACLFQELRGHRLLDVTSVTPEGDKISRMLSPAVRFENREVFFPEEAPWLADVLNELLAFPNAKHDDIVDSVSQFFNWFRKPWNQIGAGGLPYMAGGLPYTR